MKFNKILVIIIVSIMIPFWSSGCAMVFNRPSKISLEPIPVLLQDAKRYSKQFDEEAYSTIILLEIAKAQAASGDMEESRRIFDEVIEMNQSMNMHRAILEKFMNLNQKNFSGPAQMEEIQKVHLAMKKAYAFLNIARSLNQAGFRDRADDMLKAAAQATEAGEDWSIYGARHMLLAGVAYKTSGVRS